MQLVSTFLGVLLVAGLGHGFIWKTLQKGDKLPPFNLLLHGSRDEGRQAICRIPGWASGRTKGKTCIIPSGHKEHIVERPFDVLVSQPAIENLVWKYSTNAGFIQKNGVKVKPVYYPEPDTYVCAMRHWGPGKLIVWADNEVACYVAHKKKEYRFDSDFQVLTKESAQKYAITNVKYHLDALRTVEDKPLHLAKANLINHDNNDQLIHHTLTYSKSSSSSWENSFGFELGTSITVKAGVPELFDAEWQISTSESHGYSHGGSADESLELSLEAEVTIPAKHRCEVSIVARMMRVNVPYEAMITTYYSNDVKHRSVIRSGIYQGVSVSQDTVEIGECMPIDNFYY